MSPNNHDFFFNSDEEARNVPPNNTIMVRGLAQHITETDISDDIQGCGLSAKDIRLIRKKETGTVIKLQNAHNSYPCQLFPKCFGGLMVSIHMEKLMSDSIRCFAFL